MATILSVDAINVFYGRIQALRSISLNVEEGEIVALIGANGAGKTTTVRAISGLTPPAAGRVTLRGEDITHVPAEQIVAKGVGHAPEGRRIFSRMSVGENLDLGAYIRRDGASRKDLERVYHLFPRLKERVNQLAGTLSGGEQQMLCIGRALMSRPKVLLLDEPSLGLAPLMVDTIFEVIRDINREGTAVLLIEQNALKALGAANRGYVLETGRIVKEGRAAGIPRNLTRRGLCLLAVLASILAACVVPVGQRHQVGSLTIGADLPLSGDDAVDGIPVRNAINLALAQHPSVCGTSSHQDACVHLSPSFSDDVNKGIHDPAQGADNIRSLANDPTVVAVVGPLYDSVARSEIPVAESAGLALVSPSTTDPCLTQPSAPFGCQVAGASQNPGHKHSFFRVVGSQLSEAPAAADLAYRLLGKRNAYVVNDGSPMSHALATALVLRFTHDGGRIVDQSGADVIYEAGSDLAGAAALRRQLEALSPVPPLIGSDAFASDQFAKAAATAVRGSYYTVVGADASNTKSAAAFGRNYGQRFGRPPTSSSLAAFDATGVVIDAIARAIDEAGGSTPSRSQVVDELAKTSDYAGALGHFGFDGHGDTTLRWVSCYQWLAPTDPSGRFTTEIAVG